MMLATPAQIANQSSVPTNYERRKSRGDSRVQRRGGLPDLLIDEVEVRELAGGAGALLAGGGILLLGQEVTPREARLLLVVLGAGAGRLSEPLYFASSVAAARMEAGWAGAQAVNF